MTTLTLPSTTFMNSLVLMSFERAKEAVAQAAFTCRVTRRDGEPLICTQDYVPTRLNFWLRKNQVVRVAAG